MKTNFKIRTLEKYKIRTLKVLNINKISFLKSQVNNFYNMEKYNPLFQKYKINELDVFSFLEYLEEKIEKPEYKTTKDYTSIIEKLYLVEKESRSGKLFFFRKDKTEFSNLANEFFAEYPILLCSEYTQIRMNHKCNLIKKRNRRPKGGYGALQMAVKEKRFRKRNLKLSAN